jgi:AraC family transcriptional regulator
MLALTQGEYLGAIRRTVNANGVLIGLTEYQGAQEFSPMHYHENPHLSFVLSGNMSVRRKELTGTKQAIEACSFMRAGEVHQNFLHSSKGMNINLELEPAFFQTYGIQESQIGLMKDQPGSSLSMLRLYQELMIGDSSFSDQVHVVLLSLTNDWKIAGCNTAPLWVTRVRELLHDNWDRPVTLNDIARVADVHPVTISRYFNRYFGTGLGEYRRKLKVDRAIAMINSSRLSLTEISCACGFFDQSHFIKAFRSLTKTSPFELRKLTTCPLS